MNCGPQRERSWSPRKHCGWRGSPLLASVSSSCGWCVADQATTRKSTPWRIADGAFLS